MSAHEEAVEAAAREWRMERGVKGLVDATDSAIRTYLAHMSAAGVVLTRVPDDRVEEIPETVDPNGVIARVLGAHVRGYNLALARVRAALEPQP